MDGLEPPELHNLSPEAVQKSLQSHMPDVRVRFLPAQEQKMAQTLVPPGPLSHYKAIKLRDEVTSLPAWQVKREAVRVGVFLLRDVYLCRESCVLQ